MPPQRIVNKRTAATSIVRPIEALKPPPMNKSGTGTLNVILKPKPKENKNLPGTKLLIKLAKDRQKLIDNKNVSKINNEINNEVIDSMINDIMRDLDI